MDFRTMSPFQLKQMLESGQIDLDTLQAAGFDPWDVVNAQPSLNESGQGLTNSSVYEQSNPQLPSYDQSGASLTDQGLYNQANAPTVGSLDQSGQGLTNDTLYGQSNAGPAPMASDESGRALLSEAGQWGGPVDAGVRESAAQGLMGASNLAADQQRYDTMAQELGGYPDAPINGGNYTPTAENPDRGTWGYEGDAEGGTAGGGKGGQPGMHEIKDSVDEPPGGWPNQGGGGAGGGAGGSSSMPDYYEYTDIPDYEDPGSYESRYGGPTTMEYTAGPAPEKVSFGDYGTFKKNTEGRSELDKYYNDLTASEASDWGKQQQYMQNMMGSSLRRADAANAQAGRGMGGGYAQLQGAAMNQNMNTYNNAALSRNAGVRSMQQWYGGQLQNFLQNEQAREDTFDQGKRNWGRDETMYNTGRTDTYNQQETARKDTYGRYNADAKNQYRGNVAAWDTFNLGRKDAQGVARAQGKNAYGAGKAAHYAGLYQHQTSLNNNLAIAGLNAAGNSPSNLKKP